MKNKIKILLFLMLNVMIYGEQMDYKYEMSQLINKIRINAPKDYIIIQQNAADLYYRGDELRRDWLSRIDGMSQESIYYGNPKYNDRSPRGYKNILTKRYEKIFEEEKAVFITNYTDGFFKTKIADIQAKRKGFVNYNALDRELSLLNKKIKHSNNKDINDLNDVENYLYLLNPKDFKNKKKFIEEINETDYDLLIIPAFFKGEKLTKTDLNELRYKRSGGKRIIVSYLSIGEAESYRYYWKDGWKVGNPSWIAEKNEKWEGSYPVKYWDEEWHKIIIDYLNIIVESGFDGVFLDTVDTYYRYIYD